MLNEHPRLNGHCGFVLVVPDFKNKTSKENEVLGSPEQPRRAHESPEGPRKAQEELGGTRKSREGPGRHQEGPGAATAILLSEWDHLAILGIHGTAEERAAKRTPTSEWPSSSGCCCSRFQEQNIKENAVARTTVNLHTYIYIHMYI